MHLLVWKTWIKKVLQLKYWDTWWNIYLSSPVLCYSLFLLLKGDHADMISPQLLKGMMKQPAYGRSIFNYFPQQWRQILHVLESVSQKTQKSWPFKVIAAFVVAPRPSHNKLHSEGHDKWIFPCFSLHRSRYLKYLRGPESPPKEAWAAWFCKRPRWLTHWDELNKPAKRKTTQYNYPLVLEFESEGGCSHALGVTLIKAFEGNQFIPAFVSLFAGKLNIILFALINEYFIWILHIDVKLSGCSSLKPSYQCVSQLPHPWAAVISNRNKPPTVWKKRLCNFLLSFCF